MEREDLAPLHELAYETAAEHVCHRVPIASPEARAGEVRRALEGRTFDSATHVAVLDGERLVGVLTIETLLRAPEDAVVGGVMDPEPPVVAPGVDQEIAAWRAVQHDESALAVVDERGRFLGFIPPHRLLAVLLHEHDEDMARLGGFLAGASSARAASQEPVARRYWHRLPWLLVGLAGAAVAAEIVGAFEARLQAQVMLAFFIPGIVYLADAVGTQTETVVIRGLSVGVGIGQVVWRELSTGFLVGVSLALVFLPIAIWRWNDSHLAIAVSLSLFAACSVASAVAMALPWMFHRLGRDPAFGSGPLATVAQDLLSIVIYLGIATTLTR